MPAERESPEKILVVRLSSMGDVIHTLPAVATLKHSFPRSHLTWLVRPHWAPLLADNPFVDRIVAVPRSVGGSWRIAGQLRAEKFDLAVDFQGLIQSALLAAATRPDRLAGFSRKDARERLAAWFYSNEIPVPSLHAVERNLQLAEGVGAANRLRVFPLPAGIAESTLPAGPFVLASPLAGWTSKQWPAEAWSRLAQLLPIPLVLNGPPSAVEQLSEIRGAHIHLSGIEGLIDVTRRAHAVVGVDSGPMHLAAALGKPGVAIFGPTDPQRNGPYGGSLTVLRAANAATTYRREPEISESMRAISAELVAEALEKQLTAKLSGGGS